MSVIGKVSLLNVKALWTVIRKVCRYDNDHGELFYNIGLDDVRKKFIANKYSHATDIYNDIVSIGKDLNDVKLCRAWSELLKFFEHHWQQFTFSYPIAELTRSTRSARTIIQRKTARQLSKQIKVDSSSSKGKETKVQRGPKHRKIDTPSTTVVKEKTPQQVSKSDDTDISSTTIIQEKKSRKRVRPTENENEDVTTPKKHNIDMLIILANAANSQVEVKIVNDKQQESGTIVSMRDELEKVKKEYADKLTTMNALVSMQACQIELLKCDLQAARARTPMDRSA